MSAISLHILRLTHIYSMFHQGPPGDRGERGEPGDPGYIVSILTPADRVISVDIQFVVYVS